MSKYDMYRSENKRINEEILNNIDGAKKDVEDISNIAKEVKRSIDNGSSRSLSDIFWTVR